MATGRVTVVGIVRPLWLAFGFLTTLPLPVAPDYADDLWSEMGRAARWFPVVGLALGVILTIAWWLLRPVLPPPLLAVVLVITWVMLTGALHLDGLADCCDGLFAPVTAQRRLDIMRDPRVGAFGVVGVVLLLFLKAAALYVILTLPSPALISALVLAPTWARWHLIWCARLRPARPEGMGAGLRPHITISIVGTAAAVPVVLSVVAGPIAGIGRVIYAILAGGLASMAVSSIARQRLGGVTGDVFGMVVEVAEVAMLAACTFLFL